MKPTRRQALETCIIRGGLLAAVPMSSTRLFALWQDAQTAADKAPLKPTPAEVLGPFYKKHAPNTSTLRAASDRGFPLTVAGKILNTRGEPVREAKLDIWQADHEGRYDVQGYRYRTRLDLAAATEYSLETVMPGHYADRPAQHIHYLISAPGHKTLITQVYFATDPYFDGDPDKNYSKGGIVDNRDLVRPVRLYEQPANAARAAVTFDICLERA